MTQKVPSLMELMKQTFVGSVLRRREDKDADSVSVLDFGADPTGIADSTAAFNAAAATKKGVFIPKGFYSISNVDLVGGENFFGEADPRGHNGSRLRVRVNNTGAFRCSPVSGSAVEGIRIADVTIEADAGVLGAKGFLQTNREGYFAYGGFERVETSRDLQVGYEGFFIFTRWVDCRDGYVGTLPVGQEHQAITSIPGVVGQPLQTNHCMTQRCQFFGGSPGVVATVDLMYGSNWVFDGCDFELNQCAGLRARGIFQGAITNCWFEGNAAVHWIYLNDSPAPNPQGCRRWNIDACSLALIGGLTGSFINNTGAGTLSATNMVVYNNPVGCKLVNNPLQIEELYAVEVLSGDFNFLSGIRARRGNIEILNAEMTTNVINSPQAENQNVLPIGPSGLLAASFTNAGFIAIANAASQIGLAGQAVAFTLAGAGNAAYYTLPTKLLNFLKGKKVTFIVTGFGAATPGEQFGAAVWDSVAVPAFGNATAGASGWIMDDPNLATQFVTVTVGAASTSFRIGFQAGGNAPGAVSTVELAKLVLGEIKPQFAGAH